MKLLLSSVIVLSLLVSEGAIAYPKPTYKKNPNSPHNSGDMCSYPIEEPSSTYKVYVYKKFGISMYLPDNLVSMKLQNGSIDITDRGTYKLLQCPRNKRLGRGATSYNINWADDTIYYHSFPIKQNVDLYVRHDGDSRYPTYSIILRLTNKKGKLIDVNIYDEGPITQHNIKDYAEVYYKLGKSIEFLD